MLNNLGAYTVKDIAVYDKYGETSRLAKPSASKTTSSM